MAEVMLHTCCIFKTALEHPNLFITYPTMTQNPKNTNVNQTYRFTNQPDHVPLFRALSQLLKQIGHLGKPLRISRFSLSCINFPSFPQQVEQY